MPKKPYFFKRNIPKDLQTDETIKQNKKSVPKKILDKETNQIKQLKCWLCRYKKSR